MSGRRVLRDR